MNQLTIGSDNDMSPIGAKPIPEQMMSYCHLYHEKQTTVEFESK